jgi:hypothetical protein
MLPATNRPFLVSSGPISGPGPTDGVRQLCEFAPSAADILVEEGSREGGLRGSAEACKALADVFGERPRLYSLYGL